MKTQKGFSFIELNVALVVFLIGCVCIIGMLSSLTLGAKKCDEIVHCTNLAQWKLAEVMYLPAESINNATGNFPAPFSTFRWRIQNLTPADSRLVSFKEIKVTAIGPTQIAGNYTKVSLVILKKRETPLLGRGIFYTGPGGIFYYDTSNSKKGIVISRLYPEFTIWKFRVSSDKKKIVYYTSGWHGKNIGVINNEDGTSTDKFLINDPVISNSILQNGVSDIRWSPHNDQFSITTGRYIAVVNMQGNVVDKFVIDKNIPKHDWSPDGSNVLYIKNIGTTYELKIHPIGVATETTITSYTSTFKNFIVYDSYMQPKYSPDGSRIAFLRVIRTPNPGQSNIYNFYVLYLDIMDKYGQNKNSLLLTAAYSGVADSYNINDWSRDGKKILISSSKGYGAFNSMVKNIPTVDNPQSNPLAVYANTPAAQVFSSARCTVFNSDGSKIGCFIPPDLGVALLDSDNNFASSYKIIDAYLISIGSLIFTEIQWSE